MNRLRETIWRVLATGGQRHYWEPASKTYATLGWAQAKAAEYRSRGATKVEIHQGTITWEKVEDV